VRFLYPSSLTARLGLLFAMVAILTFSGVGMYLYRTLAVHLEVSDEAEMLGKIYHIQHLVESSPSVQSIQQDPHRFLDALNGFVGLDLVLKAPSGSVLLQSDPESEDVMPADAGPELRTADGSPLHRTTMASGAPLHVFTASGLTATTGEQIHITLIRKDSEKMALLAAYRREVLISVMCAAVLAMLFGYLFVRASLRPVREMARQARSITAQRLEKRLDAAAAPEEMQDFVQSFNAMLDRLHNSFQKLSQFSGDLAHDLRTPINNLMVQTQVALAQARSTEDYETLLASNVEEYERLARMLDSMLFLARVDDAKMKLDLRELDANSELTRIADYFEGVADDAGVRIEIQAAGIVSADPILFRRAVNNLVANAIPHTPEDGVIQLTAQPARDGTAICVSNPGPGIAPEIIPRLFDRFFRGDPARRNTSSSTGLGLAIVQSIMTLHDGRVEVESTPNQMTTFRLFFPMKKECSAAPAHQVVVA
jgi:two-component system heavy metal sensor histidine kinase CusS